MKMRTVLIAVNYEEGMSAKELYSWIKEEVHMGNYSIIKKDLPDLSIDELGKLFK